MAETIRIISIHALREEGDRAGTALWARMVYFYPRPPRGGRLTTVAALVAWWKFLSTPSARRATRSRACSRKSNSNFYPRPPRGGRPRRPLQMQTLNDFYPRPPRGGRPAERVLLPAAPQFLSTPSARRATMQCAWLPSGQRISIHALREEGDPLITVWVREELAISIHALREEGDFLCFPQVAAGLYFYPRPPRGGRRKDRLFESRFETSFLSTPSARRATAKTETKSLFSNKLYNILHEFRRALIYNGSKNYPNHAK